MFTRLLSLWMTGALLLALNWGTVSGNDDNGNDHEVTPTPDYDYSSVTFDYYMYNETDSPVKVLVATEINGTKLSPHNRASVLVFRHYEILGGLLVLQFCQLT